MFFHFVNAFYLLTFGALSVYFLFDSVVAPLLLLGLVIAALLTLRHLSRKQMIPDWGTSPLAVAMIKRSTRIDVFINRISRGTIGGESGWMRVSKICVSSLGAKSGENRIVPLMRYRINDFTKLRYSGDVVAGSNNGGDKAPAWVHNFRSAEKHQLFVVYNKGPSVFKALVHELNDAEDRRRALAQIIAANSGFELKQQRTDRPIPIFVLRPIGEWRWEKAPEELIQRLTPQSGRAGHLLMTVSDAF